MLPSLLRVCAYATAFWVKTETAIEGGNVREERQGEELYSRRKAKE
jgi:hypothetical protein